MRNLRFLWRRCWRFRSSAIWHCVIEQVVPNISKYCSAFTSSIKQSSFCFVQHLTMPYLKTHTEHQVSSQHPPLLSHHTWWTSTTHLNYTYIAPSPFRMAILLGLLDTEGQDTIILWNTGNYVPNDTVSHPRRLVSSTQRIWKIFIFHDIYIKFSLLR